MDRDVDTFLNRIGQTALDYKNYSVPSDLEVARRAPLLARLLEAAQRRAAARPAPATDGRP